MPPFNLNRNRQLDRQSGQVVKNIKVVFPVSWLLESAKCPAKIKSEFKDSSAEVLSMIDIVDDAMSGFHEVFLTLAKINHPEMTESINLLRQIFGEAHPCLPVCTYSEIVWLEASWTVFTRANANRTTGLPNSYSGFA